MCASCVGCLLPPSFVALVPSRFLSKERRNKPEIDSVGTDFPENGIFEVKSKLTGEKVIPAGTYTCNLVIRPRNANFCTPLWDDRRANVAKCQWSPIGQ